MTHPVSPTFRGITAPPQAQALKPNPQVQNPQTSDIGQRLEQMLWAEMLSHAGLEKAFTQAGGEAASAFSRYIVEAIAKDISQQHPMGLGQATDQDISTSRQIKSSVTL